MIHGKEPLNYISILGEVSLFQYSEDYGTHKRGGSREHSAIFNYMSHGILSFWVDIRDEMLLLAQFECTFLVSSLLL